MKQFEKLGLVFILPALFVSLLCCGCEGGGGGGQVSSWAKSYGGTDYDYAWSIQQTTAGGYIVAGYTYSFGASEDDFWVLKLSSGGAVSWQKRYDGGDDDYATSIQQTSDGGYIVAGHTTSFGAGDSDSWVLKLNSSGTVAWQKRYAGANEDWAVSIQQTSDEGYIVAGITDSFGAGSGDFWVLKLRADGTLIDDGTGTAAWQKRYGGANGDGAWSIQQTGDGGYIVAGTTSSFGAVGLDFWVLKLNSDGTVAWQKRYGGGNDDRVLSIQQISDGGYIVAGYTSSFGAGLTDFWVLKLNSDGTVDWQNAYGGAADDYASSVQQTSDDGYIVAGVTYSFGAGSGDFWVLKLNSSGTVAWQKTYGGVSKEEATSIQETRDGRYIVAGYTYSFGAGGYDFWVLRLDSDGTVSFNPASDAYMADTYVFPTTTSALGTNTAATVADTSATVADTNASVNNTHATIERQAP
jgi:uncharacterized delta-60 repeat protein